MVGGRGEGGGLRSAHWPLHSGHGDVKHSRGTEISHTWSLWRVPGGYWKYQGDVCKLYRHPTPMLYTRNKYNSEYQWYLRNKQQNVLSLSDCPPGEKDRMWFPWEFCLRVITQSHGQEPGHPASSGPFREIISP